MNNQLSHHDVETMAKALPDELEPKRDLWNGIEQAVAKTPQQPIEVSFYQRWGKVAAALLPVAFVAGLLMQQSNESNESAPWLAPVTASYEIQKRQLIKQVSSQETVNQNWQQSLKDLEKAEESLKQALIHQPEDPALMKMLTQVYQQQLDIIAKSHQPKYMQI